jgi:hypothetical protein
MNRFALIIAGAVGLACAFAAGRLSGTAPADASATRAYTLRMGDRVTMPSLNMTCTMSQEGGFPDFFCARPRTARHQVVFFRDAILVWRVGNPDKPVLSVRP